MKKLYSVSQYPRGTDVASAPYGALSESVTYGQNTQYAGNKCGLTARENYGSGPNKGNASSSSTMKGSATRDPHAKTVATASQGGRINGGTKIRQPANADKIRY